MFKAVMSEENIKRKAEGTVLEMQPNVKRKKTDIRDYLRPNTDAASQAEHQSSTATKDQAEQKGQGLDWKDAKEGPRQRCKDDTRCRSSTQTITQTPTITGAVARYVVVPIGINNYVQLLTNPNLGQPTGDEMTDRAEQSELNKRDEICRAEQVCILVF